jgi:hypothetical protein
MRMTPITITDSLIAYLLFIAALLLFGCLMKKILLPVTQQTSNEEMESP